MVRYALRIAKGITAPAYIMVPLSESDIDRAVFNGIARIMLGKDHVDTQQEFDTVVIELARETDLTNIEKSTNGS